MPPIRVLTLIAAAGLALTVAGCGRRGALEAPGSVEGPSAGAGALRASPRALPGSVGLGLGTADPDPAAVRAGDELPLASVPPAGSEAPVETSRGAKRGYRIPKDAFFLDPLL